MSLRKKHGTYNLQFGKMRLPDGDPAVVIYIEPVRPANGRQRPQAEKMDANY